MKILVTGGAGYVGTSLIPQLLARGWRVRVFDNLMFGGEQLLPFMRNHHFEFIRGDVRDAIALSHATRDVDVVIHLAAIVGYPACRANPELAIATNIGGTRNLIKAVSKSQLVLFGSTGSNYGAAVETCTEETPLNPLSLYGQTKTTAERDLLDNCSTVAFRFATAFGVSPRLRLDLLVNDFTYRAATQGYLVVYEANYMRTFIHVADMGLAFVHILEHYWPSLLSNVYNVGNDSMNYSKREICELIQQALPGTHVHYAEVGKDADARNYKVSYEKFSFLGYEANITVQDGIAELVKSFKLLNLKNPYSNA